MLGETAYGTTNQLLRRRTTSLSTDKHAPFGAVGAASDGYLTPNWMWRLWALGPSAIADGAAAGLLQKDRTAGQRALISRWPAQKNWVAVR